MQTAHAESPGGLHEEVAKGYKYMLRESSWQEIGLKMVESQEWLLVDADEILP